MVTLLEKKLSRYLCLSKEYRWYTICMKKVHYYGFIDVVIDVFYSIILYNVFMAFPGFGRDFLLMVLALFVMLNYWWTARNYSELPKYYLFDFYSIVIIMFIFTQWSNYFSDIHGFLVIMMTFFAFDSLYSFVSIFVHSEKKDEKSLQYYATAELILTLVY